MKIEALVSSTVIFRTGPATGAMAGRKGDLAPTFVLATEDAAGITRVLNYHVGIRNIDIPVWIKTETREAMLDILQALLVALSPGNITLRFTLPNGRVRQLQGCYLASGAEDDGFESLDDTDGAQVILSFICVDPYWYSSTSTTVLWSVGYGATFFPFFPLVLTASAILDRKIVINSGINFWPVWKIYGPGNNPVITNFTTGEQISLVVSLLATDTLIIDTAPLVKSVKINGVNAYQYVLPSSSLFDIDPGVSDIGIQMNLISPGISVASLTYYSRYISL